MQHGFGFPWSEDVLVPRTTVFRQRDLWCDQPLRVGCMPEHVAFQSGPWTVWLAVQKDGRFPLVENIIPDAGSASTRMHIAEEDIEFLVNTVPRLPCDDSAHKPLTVDLNGHVALLARADSTATVTRAVLTNGQRDGDELRWTTNRDYLLRAVQLGFREIELFGNAAPAVCRDAQRVYVWSLLPAADALVAGDNPVELASPLRPNAVTKTAPVANATTATLVRPVASMMVTPMSVSPASTTSERITIKMPPTNRIAATLAGIAMPPLKPARFHTSPCPSTPPISPPTLARSCTRPSR